MVCLESARSVPGCHWASPSLGLFKGPCEKYGFFNLLAPAPGAPEAPGRLSEPSGGLPGTSGALPQASGTYHSKTKTKKTRNRAVGAGPKKWSGKRLTPSLAALRANIKIKNVLPPDPGRNRPHINDFLGKLTIRTFPRDPPRGGEPITKSKIVLHLGFQCMIFGPAGNRRF